MESHVPELNESILDSHSIVVLSKYFNSINDYINLE